MTASLHTVLTWVELGLAVPTFVALLWLAAPYGRHARRGFGRAISPRLGWIVMETPAVVAFAVIYAGGQHRAALVPIVLLAMWQLHYGNRAFVYPFRLRGGARMPIVIAMSGLGFNLLNAYVNARWVSHLGSYPDGWLADPRFIIGAVLFAGGFALNQWADARLLRLRRATRSENGESSARGRYQIPRGAPFERVSCPNYLGEIIEWAGWAVATWSLAGLAFAVYTTANLAPRALAHHAWYREQFPDYPSRRRALIPGLL